MGIDPDDQVHSGLSAIIHQKRFAIANALIMVVFILGNLLLPQIFYFTHNSEVLFALGVFLSGVWGTQASILGVYAAMANQSIIVRLTWSCLGLFFFVFSILIGIDSASHGLFMRMDITMAALMAGIALACAIIIFAVGLGVRSTFKVRLVDESDSEDSRNNTFNLTFLFQLTIAIAFLMLAWRLSPIRFGSTWTNGPIVQFAKVSLLTMILALSLVAAVLQACLATAKRSIGFLLIPILLLTGTPVVVLLARSVLPNSLSFWFQLWLFFAFLTGIVLSLLIVGTIWRRTGMRLVR